MGISCAIGCSPRITDPLKKRYIVLQEVVLLGPDFAPLSHYSAFLDPLRQLSIAMATWEMAVCDGPLSELLRQLTLRADPAAEYWEGAAVQGRSSPCVIQDIENARLASPLWRDIIDSSPEWALIRLSRWDHSNEVGPLWETYDEYIMNRFFQSWDLFSKSWNMATPIACPRLRKDPVGWLTTAELSTLRALLWEPGNSEIHLEEGDSLRHARGIWVSHLHRTG